MTTDIHPLTQALIEAGRAFPLPCCGRISRPNKLSSREAPGTVRRMSLTQCQGCSKRQNVKDRQQLAATTQACWDAYIADRRARGIPPEGLRYQPQQAKEPSCAKQLTSSSGSATNSASNGVTV